MTLGIPRLRELLMTASQAIKTPVMTLPLLPHCTKADAQALANRLRRLRLAEARPCTASLSGLATKEAGCTARGALAAQCLLAP